MSSSSTPSSPSSPNSIVSPSSALNDEAVYVALGKDFKEAKLTLSWALHNCGGRKIVIVHVLQPTPKIPLIVANTPITRLDEHRVRACHEAERQDMEKILDKYMLICRNGVQAEKLCIEMDSIEKGIVELISLHRIEKLVMGGAARGHHSKKAMYVREQAPDFCQIHFVCKGHLIHTR